MAKDNPNTRPNKPKEPDAVREVRRAGKASDPRPKERDGQKEVKL